MRHWVLMAGLATGLAGCAGGPQALGITGPGITAPPPIDQPTETVPAPGAGTPSGSFQTPAPGPDGRYFNYN